MNACEVIVLELPAYVSGVLDAETSARVRAHVHDCGSCKAEVAGLERLEKLLREGLPSVTPSPTLASRFANRLAAEIAAEEESRANRGFQGFFDWILRPWLIPVAAAAMLGAVMFTPWFNGTVPTGFSAPELAGGLAEKKPAAETTVAESSAPPQKAVAAVKSAPPADLLSRPDLFVDYAIIRDLDVLEGGDPGKAG